jgi:hypothetical protein
MLFGAHRAPLQVLLQRFPTRLYRLVTGVMQPRWGWGKY